MTFSNIFHNAFGEPGAIIHIVDHLSWMDADGVVTALSGDIEIMEGPTGLRVPPVRRNHEQVAGQPGTRLRTIAHDMRTAELPVMFSAGSEEQLRDRMRAWEARFDSTRGQGQLRVAAADGKALGLTCSYVEGLELNEDGSHRFKGQPLRLAVLVFEADDPYWYELTATTQSWTIGGTPTNFFPFFPLLLNQSSIGPSGTLSVDVAGQVPTWPVWTINGPGSGITLQNVTTGRVFTWNGTLAAGDQLIIDTRPGQKTVLLNGAAAFQYVTAWDQWPLLPGTNDVSVIITAATVATSATSAWYPAYLGY